MKTLGIYKSLVIIAVSFSARMRVSCRAMTPCTCLGASPHQQGRDTKMESTCQGSSDVMVLPEEQCCSMPNDAGGWAALVERLQTSR